MEGPHECNGVDRGLINVTDRKPGHEAEVDGVDSNGLPRFNLPIHHRYQLQDLARLYQNRHNSPTRRHVKLEAVLYESARELSGETK